MIGIDVGYGDVKAVYVEDGELKYFKLPTAVAYAPSNSIDIIDSAEVVYSFQGREYIVGESARFGAFSTRSFDFLKRYSPLFIHHTLKVLKIEPTHVATGLPLGLFNRKDEMTKELITAQVDGNTIKAEFSMFPQAVGILLDYRMDDAGKVKADTAKNGIVLDIGFNTIDVLCFEKGTAIRSDAKTLDKFGISKIVLELVELINREHGIQLSDQEAKDVFLAGQMNVYGSRIDLTEAIRNITEMYFDEVMHNIRSLWDKRLQRADLLLLAGGGAVTIAKYVPSEYAKIVKVPERSEFANARGYFKALMAKQEQALKAD
ncbi:MreB-like ATPase involved in cell division [Denitrovibrio acetiphilus DSM 12809]|uniref:MreB-like ATPase involved in cell division n=1 Tax=Denitrovibrio acetiphilus (strain DSM 12809 / NBRC 114555 / N2460) TaxID=522772 RepID=D4H4Q9_DENA2|nr:ParM/StbA family protein [Denitrovibrio acetiphilus]ADD67453.1 MreB-like ATPase involved in cell division [Denitrovibrio acetiphilus DSM 12809]